MTAIGIAIVGLTLAFGLLWALNPGGVVHGRSAEKMESDREHY